MPRYLIAHVSLIGLFAILALLWASPAAALGFGDSCTPGSTGPTGTGGAFAPDKTGNNWYCNGNTDTVTYPAYWFGSTTSGCTSITVGSTPITGAALCSYGTYFENLRRQPLAKDRTVRLQAGVDTPSDSQLHECTPPCTGQNDACAHAPIDSVYISRSAPQDPRQTQP
jgi:hypothetical protein